LRESNPNLCAYPNSSCGRSNNYIPLIRVHASCHKRLTSSRPIFHNVPFGEARLGYANVISAVATRDAPAALHLESWYHERSRNIEGIRASFLGGKIPGGRHYSSPRIEHTASSAMVRPLRMPIALLKGYFDMASASLTRSTRLERVALPKRRGRTSTSVP
jgi:hypothetical protein